MESFSQTESTSDQIGPFLNYPVLLTAKKLGLALSPMLAIEYGTILISIHIRIIHIISLYAQHITEMYNIQPGVQK